MRLTVTIENKTIEELMGFSGATSKTKAVNQAVVEWIRWKKRQSLKELRGKLDFEFDMKSLDQIEIEEIEDLND